MRIMFNMMGLGKGGAERVISLLANSLCCENEVMIVANMKSKIAYSFDEKIKIVSLTKNNNKIIRKLRKFSVFMICKLKKTIKSFKPDIIISFLPEPSFRVLFLKKYSKVVKNIPVIVSVRNDPNTEYSNPLYYYIMKKLYPCADQLVLQTNDAKEYFIKTINFTGIVIHNPVSDIFLTDRYSGVREKRIVAVGRLEPQKNYKNMIDAFEIVSNKHDDYIFNIYGQGSMKNEIQDYIDKKNLSKKIILKGQVDNIKDEIYKAAVFVMSSDYEGMPNSLLEAACLGVPCVSTDCPCGGPKEILKDGENGILVKVNDSVELANGIIRMIENDKFSEQCSIYANSNSTNYAKDSIIKIWNKLLKNEY